MEEKKNIDRLFQEKFKDFEVFPEPGVWKNIEKRLDDKKKRRVLPLWLRLGGVAAGLLILISAGMWYFSTDNNLEETPGQQIITNTDEVDNETTGDEDAKVNEKVLDPSPEVLIGDEDNFMTSSSKEQGEDAAGENKEGKPVSKDKTLIKPQLFKAVDTDKIAQQIPEQKEDGTEPDKAVETLISAKEKEDAGSEKALDKLKVLENTDELTAIALEETKAKEEDGKIDIQAELEKQAELKKEKQSEEIVAETSKKWSVGPMMAPVYYNSMNEGSPIDQSLASNNKNGMASLAYGLKFNYELSDRFSLQSGINNVELGYSTENVTALLSSSQLGSNDSNITTNVEGVAVSAMAALPEGNIETFGQRSTQVNISGNLDQILNYIEVPMEAKYKLVDKKFGVNVIGGFSTYVLYKNQISINSSGDEITLGEATNLNPVNFSGNLGLDFDYKITKRLFINVSPMFKYQFNTFSENSGGFQPYYLGVYTGLNFRF